jgi:hypothetical protein
MYKRRTTCYIYIYIYIYIYTHTHTHIYSLRASPYNICNLEYKDQSVNGVQGSTMTSVIIVGYINTLISEAGVMYFKTFDT